MKKILASLAIISFIITGCNTKEDIPTPDEQNTPKIEVLEKTISLNNQKITVKLDYALVNSDEEIYNVILNVENKELERIKVYGIDSVKILMEKAIITTIKGQDKEYLLFSPNTYFTIWATSDLYILNTNDIIAKLHDEENISLVLTGNGINKYKQAENGKYNRFYTITNDTIYYLTSPDASIKNITEYVVTINNDTITTSKTGNKFVGSEPEGGSSTLATISAY